MRAPILVELPLDGPEAFVAGHIFGNARLCSGDGSLARIMMNGEPRTEAAARLGTSLGALLRSLNATAEIEPPKSYCYASVDFEVRVMRGVCDDLEGGRYALFGTPLTIRFYLRDDIGVPQWVFDAADWNFLGAGFRRFLGYAYGCVANQTLFLSGLQSDLAARYAYLFQGRGGLTEVRVGEDVVPLEDSKRAQLSAHALRNLRRKFQRRWISVLAAGLRRVMEGEGLNRLAIHQFPLTEAEEAPGHQMWRIYRNLPLRLGSSPLTVQAAGATYHYLAIDRENLPSAAPAAAGGVT
ncbi:MAG TPA: hypothetical protein VN240_07175 [Propylenella sp.]|nr:hypothetical protein [Propylenella sp.]